MKYAISSAGPALTDALDSRFGRAKYFIFFDSESREFTAVENKQNLQALQGAGIQSAMRVAENEAQIVLTGHCGPKAFRVLTEAEIKVFTCQAATVSEAIEQYEQGQLAPLSEADVEGHW